ncbi:MAG: NifU family protein [Bacteroidetes bacterium]|nr:NifU family protein [Bacteroidota bacterium]
MNTTLKQPIITYAESTPNPSAMKFVANKILLENSLPLEFLNPSDAKSSPLAAELFKFPFVKSVFISGNYITLFKVDSVEWDDVTLELREFLREYLSSGKAVTTSSFTELLPVNERKAVIEVPPEGGDLEGAAVDHAIPQTEIEQKIIDTLEQYVRPAVEQDGGMIVFRSYKDGVVSLLMRGACSGCPSSTVTLKAGIQAILKKFVPEVMEVVSEA